MGSASVFHSHLQPLAQAQLLHALVGARHVQFLCQGDDVALVAQGGAEQVGQILHRLLGARGIAAREGGDGVHAVEEEVRPDARLQGMHARGGAQLDAAAPVVRDVEVAQREPGDDEPDPGIADHEARRIDAETAPHRPNR